MIATKEGITKYLPNYATANVFITNAYMVSSDGIEGEYNKTGYVVTGMTLNLPPDCNYGIREVYYYNTTNILVKITGWSSSGYIKEWFDFYNGSNWNGWVSRHSKENSFVGVHVFNSENTEISSNVTYTMPYDGKLFVRMFAARIVNAQVQIYINGYFVSVFGNQNDDANGIMGSELLTVSAGDVVEIRMYDGGFIKLVQLYRYY